MYVFIHVWTMYIYIPPSIYLSTYLFINLSIYLSTYLSFFPFYSILFYYILFFSILLYSILLYSIIFYSIILYSVLFYFYFYSVPILFYSILCYSILFWSDLIWSIYIVGIMSRIHAQQSHQGLGSGRYPLCSLSWEVLAGKFAMMIQWNQWNPEKVAKQPVVWLSSMTGQLYDRSFLIATAQLSTAVLVGIQSVPIGPLHF